MKAAFDSAVSGATITLAADITYSPKDLGTINVADTVTLDFNGHKITTTNGFVDVSKPGNLTVQNLQMDISYDNTMPYGVFNDIYGTLTIVSTSGTGVTVAREGMVDFIENVYGQVVIEDGVYKPDYCLIYSVGNSDNTNAGQVLIKNAVVSDTKKLVCYLYAGSIQVENGQYTTDEDCFDDMCGGSLTIKDGVFSAGNAENSGYCIDVYENNSSTPDAVVTIEGGTFTSTDHTILAADDAVINISGGSFSSNVQALELQDKATANLTGGSFTNTSGDCAISVEASSTLNIPEGYQVDPVDWETSLASQITISEISVSIDFYVEDALWKHLEGVPSELEFPEDPVHSQGYAFFYWVDALGQKVDDIKSLRNEAALYAVFSDKTFTVTFEDKGTTKTESVAIDTLLVDVPGVDRVDTGDAFYGWQLGDDIVSKESTLRVHSDLVLTALYFDKVTTYDELISALNAKRPVIVLGANIPITAEVKVDYSCIIDGNGFGLIRPEGYTDVLLSVANGIAGGDSSEAVDTDKTTLTVKNVTVDGSNLSAEAPAVFVDQGTTLLMNNSVVQNNVNSSWFNAGGGIAVEGGATVVLNGCIIKNNESSDGGGLHAEDSDATYKNRGKKINLTLNSCQFLNNKASQYGGGVAVESVADINITDCVFDSNTAKRNGGGLFFDDCYNEKDGTTLVRITDTTICRNTAEYGGGIDVTRSVVHLYGTTSVDHNTARIGGASYSQNGGGPEDTCIHMHDTSSMSYNEAEENGGAVYQWEQSLHMYDESSLHNNRAGKDGGAVYSSCYWVVQNGGVIRDNYAGGKGGGVYALDRRSAFVAGMMFDNLAEEGGDDLFQDNSCQQVYPTQANRLYNDGNSLALKTVDVEKIEGYYEVPLNTISVPYYGWFIDGTLVAVKRPASWNPNIMVTVYEVAEGTRYDGRTTGVLVSKENDNLGFLTGQMSEVGGKAIWYGLLLAYDANYEGSTDHQYDTQAYRKGASASVADNMFTRPGYRFIGWNTQPDGSGTAYEAGNDLPMANSQVLYAQWEKTYSVTYVVNNDPVYGAPTDVTVPTDPTVYLYENPVEVADKLASSQDYAIVDGQKVYGEWTFTGWDKEDFIITEDTVITGEWTFTPNKPVEPIKPDDPVKPTKPDMPNNPNVVNKTTTVIKNVSVSSANQARPKTGDEAPILLWLSLLLVAGSGLTGVVIARKRKTHVSK
ncbi:MAG: InlB B-repeat-containing protein [Lachnospiraceae bacterium]|nr:InlB B-repeat-containing protein [Lachnospiraceae bacterium]